MRMPGGVCNLIIINFDEAKRPYDLTTEGFDTCAVVRQKCKGSGSSQGKSWCKDYWCKRQSARG